MSYYLTDEIIESLTEYASKVEQAYRERPLCHFDWKPARIEADRIHPNKVLFDIVWLDDESLKGCVSVDDVVITDYNMKKLHKLDFSIWEYNHYLGNSTAKFVIPYHGGNDWDSIGQYIYGFVDEVDTLLRCY
jgi:hypothetical protein